MRWWRRARRHHLTSRPFSAPEPARSNQEPERALTEKRSRVSGKRDTGGRPPYGAIGTSDQRSDGWKVRTPPSERSGAPGATGAAEAAAQVLESFRQKRAAPRAPCPPRAALRGHRTCPGPSLGAASTR